MTPRSSLASSVALGLATLVLPFAILSSWLEAVVTDTDRYVSTVAPLAEDPVVQDAVEVRLEAAALSAIDVDRRERQLRAMLADRNLSPALRAALAAPSGTLRGAITSAVHNAVLRVVRDPAFATAWADANRSAHEQLVGVLSGEDSELLGNDGRISIQLDTLLSTVFGILGTEGLVDPANLPDLEASFTFVRADDLERAQQGYDVLDRLGFWLPVIWLLLVVLAVVLARDRRRALRFVAYGVVLGVVLLAVALRVGRNQIIGTVGPGDAEVVSSVWDILFVTLREALGTLLVLAVVLLAVVWLSGRRWFLARTGAGLRSHSARSTSH